MSRRSSIPSRAALNRAWTFLKEAGHTLTAVDVMRDGAMRLHLGGAELDVPVQDEDLDHELSRFRERHGYG